MARTAGTIPVSAPWKISQPNTHAAEAAAINKKVSHGKTSTRIERACCLCHPRGYRDVETLAMWRDAVTRGDGRPSKTGDNITGIERVTGTSRSYTVSRLRREAPALFEEVKEGRARIVVMSSRLKLLL
jgi:hypothetical protein